MSLMKDIVKSFLIVDEKNINGLITIYINKAKKDKAFLEELIEEMMRFEEKNYFEGKKLRKIRYKFTEEMLKVKDFSEDCEI